MKKNFFKTAFVSLFAVVALCSCDKDEDKNNDAGVIVKNTITAAVEKGNTYNTQIDSVKAVIDNYKVSGSVYKDGGFTLKLPAALNDTLLNLLFNGDTIPSEVKVSDSTAKIRSVDIDAYKSGKQTGSFYHGTTEWKGLLMYANKNVTIAGSVVYDGKYTDKFTNMHLKQGWNIVYKKETSTGNNKENKEIEYTTQIPNNAKWHYDANDK
jgi:hypothetical protein